jgi:hypothetical protein
VSDTRTDEAARQAARRCSTIASVNKRQLETSSERQVNVEQGVQSMVSEFRNTDHCSRTPPSSNVDRLKQAEGTVGRRSNQYENIHSRFSIERCPANTNKDEPSNEQYTSQNYERDQYNRFPQVMNQQLDELPGLHDIANVQPFQTGSIRRYSQLTQDEEPVQSTREREAL